MALVFIVGLLLLGWVEISVFIFISKKVGSLLTFLGVFLTAIVGINFLKNRGLSVLNRVHSDLVKGHPPVASIADSISLVFGGGLLLIPGYVTDSLGLLLFIPGFRTMAGMWFLQWVAKKPSFNAFVNFRADTFTRRNGNQEPFGFRKQSHHENNFDDIIEGDFEERPAAKFHIKQKKKDRHNDF